MTCVPHSHSHQTKSLDLPSQFDEELQELNLLTQRTEDYFEVSSQSDLVSHCDSDLTTGQNYDRIFNMKITTAELRARCSKPCYARALSMKANPDRLYFM